jgi:hypothetical protein
MSGIAKELAEAIAKKLKATVHSKKNRPHDLYQVWFDGRLIAAFGISRGSKKDKGQNHIPGAIHLGPHDARLFGQCTHSYEFWVEEMRTKGLLPPQPEQIE